MLRVGHRHQRELDGERGGARTALGPAQRHHRARTGRHGPGTRRVEVPAHRTGPFGSRADAALQLGLGRLTGDHTARAGLHRGAVGVRVGVLGDEDHGQLGLAHRELADEVHRRQTVDLLVDHHHVQHRILAGGADHVGGLRLDGDDVDVAQLVDLGAQ
jgi:hypothetical protein